MRGAFLKKGGTFISFQRKNVYLSSRKRVSPGAAMGVSQETDALAIIVSEETGNISAAYKGQFHLRLTAEELERILTKED